MEAVKIFLMRNIFFWKKVLGIKEAQKIMARFEVAKARGSFGTGDNGKGVAFIIAETANIVGCDNILVLEGELYKKSCQKSIALTLTRVQAVDKAARERIRALEEKKQAEEAALTAARRVADSKMNNFQNVIDNADKAMVFFGV